MNCLKCDAATACDNTINCGGLCKNVVHYKCAGLRKAAFELICSSDNVFWFCDSCKLCYNLQVTKLTEICEITKNIDYSLKSITDKMLVNRSVVPALVEDSVGLSVRSDVPTGTGNAIIFDTAIADSRAVQPVKDSRITLFDDTSTNGFNTETDRLLIPSTTHTLLNSTKTFAEVVSSSSSSSSCVTLPTSNSQRQSCQGSKPICGTRHFAENFGVKNVVPMLWLHLSKFDPDTTEEDISLMAKTCLAIDNCKVFKLLPKQRIPESLNYVNYKLGINAELRAKALVPENWPTGVFVREFKNFRTTLPPRAKFRTSPLQHAVNTITI